MDLVFVFRFFFNALPYLGPEHIHSSPLFSARFILSYSLFYHLLLVGFTYATLSVKFTYVRLVCCTRLPYAVERGPIPDTSVWEHHMFYGYHRYCITCVSSLLFTGIWQRLWANTQLFLFLLLLFSFYHSLIKLKPGVFTLSFTKAQYKTLHDTGHVWTCSGFKKWLVQYFGSEVFVDYWYYCMWNLIQFRILNRQSMQVGKRKNNHILSVTKQQLR